MVTQFQLDYMHVVCFGVTRKMLKFWIKRHLKYRLGSPKINATLEKLIGMSQYIPCEFAWRPRSLSEWDGWKATEFRQFLLDTGPVALKEVLPTSPYSNVLTLSINMYLMLSPTLCAHYCADNLLKYFPRQLRMLYGVEEMVYNVHCLCHLADDVRRFGPLDRVSAFPFENFLGHLKKKKVRKSQHILRQITNVVERKSTGKKWNYHSDKLGG